MVSIFKLGKKPNWAWCTKISSSSNSKHVAWFLSLLTEARATCPFILRAAKKIPYIIIVLDAFFSMVVLYIVVTLRLSQSLCLSFFSSITGSIACKLCSKDDMFLSERCQIHFSLLLNSPGNFYGCLL